MTGVTHDQEEALTMSDRVVVMKDGEIQQIGTPQDIYNEPKNAFVADFIGESNIIDGVMYEDFEVEFGSDRHSSVSTRALETSVDKELSVYVVVEKFGDLPSAVR